MSIDRIAEGAVFKDDHVKQAYLGLSPDQRRFFNEIHGVGPHSEVLQDSCGAWPDYREIARQIQRLWGSDGPAGDYLAAISPEYIMVQEAAPAFRLPTQAETPMYQ